MGILYAIATNVGAGVGAYKMTNEQRRWQLDQLLVLLADIEEQVLRVAWVFKQSPREQWRRENMAFVTEIREEALLADFTGADIPRIVFNGRQYPGLLLYVRAPEPEGAQ